MLNKSLALFLVVYFAATTSLAIPVHIKQVASPARITRELISVNALDNILDADHVADIMGNDLGIGNPGDPTGQVGQVVGEVVGGSVAGQLGGSGRGGAAGGQIIENTLDTAEAGVSGLTKGGTSHDL